MQRENRERNLMIEDEVIQRTADYMKGRLIADSSGHDWYHTYRVWQLGKKIADNEGADLYVVELACLLHDIADFKLHNGDEEIGPRLAGEWLQGLGVKCNIVDYVREIIATTSFKGANAENKVGTLEGMCVQDADRLDAIGAIGLARCFAFGGNRGNIIYDPEIPIHMSQSEKEYKKADHSGINHVYEKLLLLKDRMNTDTAREMVEASGKHKFMELFLEQFLKEWNLEI